MQSHFLIKIPLHSTLLGLSLSLLGSSSFIPELSVSERRTLVNQQFNLDAITYKSSSVILPYTIGELNLVTGSKETPDMHLRNRIDGTQTTFGSVMLDYLLQNPNFTLDAARKRQDALKELFYNQDLLDSSRKTMAAIAQEQNALLIGWSTSNPFIKESTDILASVGNVLGASHSPMLLELIRKGLNTANYAAIGAIVSFFLYRSYEELSCVWARKWQLTIDFKNWKHWERFFLLAVPTGLQTGWYHKIMPIFEQPEATNLEMQTMMMGVSKAFKASRQLYNSLKDFPALTKVLHHFGALEKFTTNHKSFSSQAQTLMYTFAGEPSTWSNMGRVRSAYADFMDTKNEFVPLFEAVGEIDAFLGIAHIMLEHKDKSQHYCFTEFILDAEAPRFEVVDVWNPVLQTNERAAEKLVTETLSLGGGKESVANMLLTGPHGSGKSSLMRSSAYAVILSEIFGIAPAKSCYITFFSHINTYLSVQDNMEKGLSAFMAAQNRLDAIQKRILELKEDRFGISFIDEPVKDTFESNASKLITKFGIDVGPVTEHVCILATHYTEPALALEDQATGRFTNFHMAIQERTFGRFRRLFKLTPGKADWWFNDAPQRERYISWLKTIV